MPREEFCVLPPLEPGDIVRDVYSRDPYRIRRIYVLLASM